MTQERIPRRVAHRAYLVLTQARRERDAARDVWLAAYAREVNAHPHSMYARETYGAYLWAQDRVKVAEGILS